MNIPTKMPKKKTHAEFPKTLQEKKSSIPSVVKQTNQVVFKKIPLPWRNLVIVEASFLGLQFSRSNHSRRSAARADSAGRRFEIRCFHVKAMIVEEDQYPHGFNRNVQKRK